MLNISVNELLSGEILDNSYKEKAEENLIGLIKQKQTDKLSLKKIMIWQLISLITSIILWFLLFDDSNVFQLGHRPTPHMACFIIVGFISIYSVIAICIYGVIKRNLSMIFAALFFASSVCLLICLKHSTFWLITPAIAGIFICFSLSLWNFYKNRKIHLLFVTNCLHILIKLVQ